MCLSNIVTVQAKVTVILNQVPLPAGRWPAEEAAFRKTKAALGCQLAEALASSFGAAASASEDCIDVLSDGFAFRLFLWSTR